MDLKQIIEAFNATSFQIENVYRYTVPAGKKGRQKSAPFPGFIFPLGGEAQFSFNGTCYVTDPQKIIHGGADMDLDKAVLGTSDLKYISILYDVRPTRRSQMSLAESHFDLSIGYNHRLKGLLHRLWQTAHLPGALPAFQQETLFRCILEELFVSAENNAVQSDRMLFSKILNDIHLNYAEPLSLSSLAEQYEVNNNRLYYLFMKYAGISPSHYLIAYRLNHAKEMLLTSEDPIWKIANAVGYEDPLYFSRIFKKHFHISPSQMKQFFRNNP